MLEVSTTVRVDFKMESVLVHFRKNPNRKKGRNGKKTPRIFRFVTLPVEIPDKMKLHPWKFYKFLLHPLEFQVKNQEPRPMQIPHIFWITLQNSTSFLLTPGISTFYFFNNPGTNFHVLNPRLFECFLK